MSIYAAIVTSTSTPASMLMMICFTTSVGALRSIKRLWILKLGISLHHPFLTATKIFDSPHLVHIPSLTALTARRLARGNLQILRRQPHRSLHAQLLGFGAIDKFAADFLQSGDFAGGEGDADFVDFGLLQLGGLLGVLERHFGW